MLSMESILEDEDAMDKDSDNAEHDDAEFDNTDMPMDQGEELGKTDKQPNDEVVPKNGWYKKSRSDTSPDPEWNEGKLVDDESEQIKALMALADEERVSVVKESARNGEWIKISMKKVHILLKMEDNDDRKSFLDYMCIDLNYVEEQINNLISKHRNLVQEQNTCKEQLGIKASKA
ncbi:hypothetical protein Tco_0173484 [Tanacetum coccineum]